MNAPVSLRLDGKIALVTGATRGIGEAIARAFAASGAQVIVSSRKQDMCEAVACDIRNNGGHAEALACHVGEMAQIDAQFAAIEARHGRLDILVNNGAASPHFGHIVDTDLAAFQKTVDVNIRGYFFCSSLAAKLMAKNGGGSIINIASVGGVAPGPGQGIYSITKGAVITMTRAFANECGPMGVRVNAILPGVTDTKLAATLVRNPEMLGALMPRITLQRVAQPDEMAGAALYLASDASSYTTGACLNVDGGLLAA
jgi:NAD(P)-dependent dehydrogenase (short-subunit alcohol dehydrogenase family)